MSHEDPRYTDINNGRNYPAVTRAEAHKAALRILRALGSPSLCAIRARPDVGPNYEPQSVAYLPKRADLARIYRRYTKGGKTGRRCWASTTPTTGHDKGWGRLIHDVSHILQEYRHPKLRPHDSTHNQIERDVQLYVETSGMLNPKLPSARPEVARAARYVSICERLKRWESKRKRAETAIRKLSRQKRRLEALKRAAVQGREHKRGRYGRNHGS